jgi:hypothetical protein
MEMIRCCYDPKVRTAGENSAEHRRFADLTRFSEYAQRFAENRIDFSILGDLDDRWHRAYWIAPSPTTSKGPQKAGYAFWGLDGSFK